MLLNCFYYSKFFLHHEKTALNAVRGNSSFLKFSRGSLPPGPPRLNLHCTPQAPPAQPLLHLKSRLGTWWGISPPIFTKKDNLRPNKKLCVFPVTDRPSLSLGHRPWGFYCRFCFSLVAGRQRVKVLFVYLVFRISRAVTQPKLGYEA